MCVCAGVCVCWCVFAGVCVLVCVCDGVRASVCAAWLGGPEEKKISPNLPMGSPLPNGFCKCVIMEKAKRYLRSLDILSPFSRTTLPAGMKINRVESRSCHDNFVKPVIEVNQFSLSVFAANSMTS